MNISGFMLKFNTILSSGASRLSSLIAAESKIQNTFDASSMTSATFTFLKNGIVNFVVKLIYIICQFILNIIEVIELTINRLLGINIDLKDYQVIDQSNPMFKVLTNETFTKVFRYVLGVSIVLVIVFTIFALIKSEYAFATDDGQSLNTKTGIFRRSLKSLFVMGFFPVVILVSVILINAVLAGFNNILRSNEKTTIAAQVFATSAYNANNYRTYANNDTRIPIIINFDDPMKNGQMRGYSSAELAEYYKRFQKKGAALYNDFADNNFGSFTDNLIYKNNRLYNKDSYSGFEKFVCTKEQYMVMADFVDYAVKHNLTYYVKNMKDDDINWKWVDESIYDKETQTLKITYKDTSNITGGETYTVWYTPSSMDISTPIGDAVRTLSALLGIGEYEDNNFDVLKRLEDSINVVEWETARVFLKLSDTYASAPTVSDQLILYEQARWEYNNTLNYSLSELENGIDDLPVYKITKREYQASSGKYVVTAELYAVRINGTFYEVEENPDFKDEAGNYRRDSFGDPYYTLVNSTWKLEKEDDLETIGETVYKGYKYYTEDQYGNKVEHTDKVNLANDIVTVKDKNGNVIGKYYKSRDSFKDIIVEVLNGTYEQILDNNLIANVSYNDTYEKVIKQTSWPKKLINDLQVIYKDINFNHLLTTGDWLKNLGEYVSSDYKNEIYGSSIQTGFIHPLGLILAEMFFGDIDPADEYNIYSSLDYNSKFDDETVKAFILSMLGEDRYYQLKEELKYFEEIFNIFMGSVLDEISYYENFELLSGNEQSIQLYTYKAYLASVLLSSNSANWFFETASSMLGINEFLADLVNSDGYYKSFSNLSAKNRQMLKNLLNNGKKVLKSTQSLTSENTGYPEYMKVLEAYIGGNDYFEGRLGYVLTSNKSDEQKAKDIDTAKSDLKTKYTALKTWVESHTNFQGIFDAFIKAAESEYTIIGEQNKTMDYYDNLTTLMQVENEIDSLYDLIDRIQNAMAQHDADGNIVKDGSGNIQYEDAYLNSDLDNKTKDIDDFIASVKTYKTAVKKYLECKEDYYTPDTSASLIGQHDKLVKERNNALKQASEFYNNYVRLARKAWLPDQLVSELEAYKEPTETFADFFKKLFNSLQGNATDFNLIETKDSLDKLKKYVESLKNNRKQTLHDLKAVSVYDFGNVVVDNDGLYVVSGGGVDRYRSYLTEDEQGAKAWTDNEIEEEINRINKIDVSTLSERQLALKQLINNIDNSYDLYVNTIEDYIQTQEKIDKLNRYEIVFGVRSLISEGVSKLSGNELEPLEFDVVASNKHYTVGQNFTRAKFIEYVLGSQFLKSQGYEAMFVSDDYDGIVTLDTYIDADGKMQYVLYRTNQYGEVVPFKTDANGNFITFVYAENDKITDGPEKYSVSRYKNIGDEAASLDGMYVKVVMDTPYEFQSMAQCDVYNKIDKDGNYAQFELDDKNEIIKYRRNSDGSFTAYNSSDKDHMKHYDEFQYVKVLGKYQRYTSEGYVLKDGKYYMQDPSGKYMTTTNEEINKTACMYGYHAVDAFKEVREFAIEIGQMSAELYQMTNLINLSKSTKDDLVIGQDYKDLLLQLIDNGYLTSTQVKSIFGVDGTITDEKEIKASAKDIVNSYTVIQSKNKAIYIVNNLSKDQIESIFGFTCSDLTEARTKACTIINQDLAKQMLLTIVSCDYPLADSWVKELFGVDESGIEEIKDASTGKITYKYAGQPYNSKSEILAVKAEAVVNAYTSDQSNSKLNDVLAYLLMTNPDSTKKDFVDYSVMTLKDLRKKLLSTLVNYEQQQGDTVEQNQKRYLSILALSCSDWQDSGKVGADDGSWAISRLEKNLKLVVSNQSMGTILRLAGLSNRPYEELVGAEYSIDFDLGGVDEKNGDIFIICTFDSETKTYVPFMMANEYGAQGRGLKVVDDENESENTWYKKFDYLNSYSDYYAVNPSITPIGEQPADKKFVYYPIIARGLVYSDGMPTAIREVDGNIEYYRDDVVIRDASDIGLETYYLSMDAVTVHHSLVSSIVNGFTKLFTGKTLVEQIASSIPRFAAHTDYNFCYGVDDTIKFTSQDGVSYMSFNFNTGTNFSTKYKLDCVYQMDRLNVLILLIGTIGILSAVWKALWGAAGRILDVAVDVLIGPAVVATLNLKYDQISDKEVKEVGFESYDKWKQKTQDDLLGVFAYAIGFNIFFIIVPIITGLNLFSTADAFATLPLANKLSLSFLNEIGRLIFLVGAAYLMKRAPALFAKVSGTGDGFAAGERVYGSVKNTINTVRDVVSGQELIDKVKDAKENTLNMIPGRQLAKKITQKTIANATFVAASAAGIASGQGVFNSIKQARKMKKTMEAEFEKEEKLRQKRKEEREERNKARQQWMSY